MEEEQQQAPEVVEIKPGLHLRLINRRGISKTSKKVIAAIFVILILVGGLFVLLDLNKPAYVIGDVKITVDEINDYSAAIDEYKAFNKEVDFGGDSKSVARDDLVQNAAFKVEAAKAKNLNIDSKMQLNAVSIIENKKFAGSARVQRMQKIRQQNNAYQLALVDSVLMKKQLLQVNAWFDAPFYSNKNKDEVATLYNKATSDLNDNFLPRLKKGETKEQIAKSVDVNLFDDNPSDDENNTQYFDKQVTTIDSFPYTQGVSKYNELKETEYNGVKIDNLKSFDQMVKTLNIPGDVTPVFASNTGAFMVMRLESISGGRFKSWKDMINTYKKNNAKRILFASDINPSKVISTVADKAILKLTNPGLQKAYAISSSCSGHEVVFIIRSIDISTLTFLPGNSTVVHQYRRASNCGGQYTGDRNTNNVFGALADNCWSPAPNWSVERYADGSKWALNSMHSSESGGKSKVGWPSWVSSKINGVGTIYIDFWYTPVTPIPDPGPGPGPTPSPKPTSGGTVDVPNIPINPGPTTNNQAATSTCDLIKGWIFNTTVPFPNNIEVHIFFNARKGQPGAVEWNIGVANKYRPDVNTAYPGVGDNHGFSFNPLAAPRPAGLDIYSGEHNMYFYAENIPTPYEFWSAKLPVCSQPPATLITADPSSNTTLDPDQESPTEALLSSQINMTGSGYTTSATREYYVIPSSAPADPLTINSTWLIDRSKLITVSSNPITETINNDTNFGGEVKIIDPIKTLGLSVGDRICVRTTVAKQSIMVDYLGKEISAQGPISTNNEGCAYITSTPYVAFYGNDVFAGGGYTKNTTTGVCDGAGKIEAITRAGVTGPGIQFAAFALGAIDQFSSARLRTSDPQSPNGLTFSNNTSTVGNFKANRCQYDYYIHRDDTVAAVDLGSSSITDLTDKKIKRSGTVNLGSPGGIAIATGTHSSLYVDGDVVISSDIKYNSAISGWSSLAEIPSFTLVVRGNIYIDPSVTQLDGVFVSQPGGAAFGAKPTDPSGNIFTCYNSTDTSHRFKNEDLLDKCDKRLVVNGSFQAQNVYLDRTAGSLRDSKVGSNTESTASGSKAAEVFNFTPEVYLGRPQIPVLSDSGGTSLHSVQILAPVL